MNLTANWDGTVESFKWSDADGKGLFPAVMHQTTI
jgi:hypothetical protein